MSSINHTTRPRNYGRGGNGSGGWWRKASVVLSDAGVTQEGVEVGAICVALALALLLRVFGDAMPFAPMIGALAGRGSLFAIFTTGVGAFVGVARVLLTAWQPSSWLTYLRRCAVIGIAINLPFTLALVVAFRDIDGRIDEAEKLRGFVTVESPVEAMLTFTPKAGGGFIISAPSCDLPPMVEQAILAVEDIRGANRATGGIDVHALARACTASAASAVGLHANVQGASTPAETAAGLLYGIPHGGPLFERASNKLKKFALGLRISDSRSFHDQVRLLAALADFGTVGGNDVKGVRAAALVYYGKEMEELLPAEAAELASRLANPNRFSPYQRVGESDARFAVRHNVHRARVEWALSRMVELGTISDSDAAKAKDEIFITLSPRQVALARLRPPFIKSVFRELSAAMLWPSSRHVIVRVAATPATQAALEDAIRSALPIIEGNAGRRAGDSILVDALAVDADGVVVARAGLWSAPSEQSSITKVVVLALALERGVIKSLDDVVAGRTVRRAVETSYNPAFNELVARIGPEEVAAALRSLGYSADVAHARIGLGGGVTATLPVVAGMVSAVGFSNSPGQIVTPRVVAEARDADTGAVLLAASPARVFDERVALEVRNAMEGVALRGTASAALARLAASHAVATKTGTSAFTTPEGHLEGRGGSWIAASDSATRITLIVRVRWASGEPFDVEAAHSAAFVAQQFINNARGARH